MDEHCWFGSIVVNVAKNHQRGGWPNGVKSIRLAILYEICNL